MQEQHYSFNDLRSILLKKLEDRGCTPITITGYRYQCNSIFKWLSANGCDHYTEEGGKLFLQNYISVHGDNQYYYSLRTVVQRLNDVLKDVWSDVHPDKGRHFCLSDEFNHIVDRYCLRNDSTGHAPGTIMYKRYAISWFLHELAKMNCKTLDDLSPMLVTQACIKISNHSLWPEIKVFLRYLNEFESVKCDYSTLIPHYSKPYVIPSVYSIDEIRKIEEAIDTSTVKESATML